MKEEKETSKMSPIIAKAYIMGGSHQAIARVIGVGSCNIAEQSC